MLAKFEDTKGVVRSVSWRTNSVMVKRKKNQQWSTNHYNENWRLINTNPTDPVGAVCSTGGIHRATLIIHPVIIHEQFILTVYGSYKWRWPPTRLFIIIAVFILFVINYVKVFNIISSEFTQDKYCGES